MALKLRIINSVACTKAYVDDVQTAVEPLTPQVTKQEIVKESKSDELFDNAIDIINSIDEVDDISVEDGLKPNVDEIKITRAVKEQINNGNKTKTESLKQKIAGNLVSMAVSKGIIDEDDSEMELQKILSMNDNEFKKYEQEIDEYIPTSDVVTSANSKEDISLSEADMALKKIKNNNGRGIIGDFSKQMPSAPIRETASFNDIDSSGSRSLKSIANKGSDITFSNQYVLPSSEDQLAESLSNLVDVNAETPVVAKKSLNLDGFKDITGIKKPMVITTVATPHPGNVDLKGLFSEFNWTTISKKK